MKTRQNVLLSRTKDKSDKEQTFNAMLLLRRKDNKNPATEQIDIHEEINDMPDTAQHDEDGYIAAVDHTNQTLWIFFYDNAEESATIMRHIRKDLLVFQNIQ